jgi:23S rRNA (cytidine1920-2'-O)/16S rRNA (cytidine1409-2'-O)-methyltransferase
MIRLDTYLFENNFTQSRNKAKELILNGDVLVNGKIITKPALMVLDEEIKIISSHQYVSRAGDKLKNFLLQHPLEIKGKYCLDVGSSTGGFVEVLLEYGAKEVVGVDVGSAQLHPTLQNHERVISVEGCDIRDFNASPFDIVTCDVSFVGSEHILSSLDRLSKRDIIMLFKPQFEVGRTVKRDRKGVVKDSNAIIDAQKRFEAHFAQFSWLLETKAISKIKGKEGNVEIFYHFRKK